VLGSVEALQQSMDRQLGRYEERWRLPQRYPAASNRFAELLRQTHAQTGLRVVVLVNMGVMLGPMLLQPLVGWALDTCWTGTLVDGVRRYDAAAYRAGFSLMIAWLALSLLLLLFTRETRCRQIPAKP
jgi:hypothetical protein